MSVTLYHNPHCGTSRKALTILRDRGVEPAIVDYIQHPPTREQWTQLIHRSGLGARAFLRTKEALYAELGLDDPKWTDAQLIGFLTEHPKLLNRPVVETTKGIRPCRPAETVQDLL